MPGKRYRIITENRRDEVSSRFANLISEPFDLASLSSIPYPFEAPTLLPCHVLSNVHAAMPN